MFFCEHRPILVFINARLYMQTGFLVILIIFKNPLIIIQEFITPTTSLIPFRRPPNDNLWSIGTYGRTFPTKSATNAARP